MCILNERKKIKLQNTALFLKTPIRVDVIYSGCNITAGTLYRMCSRVPLKKKWKLWNIT